MQRFTNPRDLYHGKGALEALKTLKGKKAVICVGGGSMKRFCFLQKAQAYLEEAGMEVALIEGIEPDPSVTTVMKGAEKMLEFQPDWIIAMGGGSPIDAAKAMWIKYEYRQCGSNMSIRNAHLKTCARSSGSRNFAEKQNSLPSLPPPEQRQK